MSGRFLALQLRSESKQESTHQYTNNAAGSMSETLCTENQVHFKVIFKHYKPVLQLLLVYCAILLIVLRGKFGKCFLFTLAS